MIITNLTGAQHYRREIVDVPELGDGAQIIVREMSVQGLLDYQGANFDADGKPLADNPYQWMVSLLVACMVDDAGNPIANQADVPAIMQALPKGAMERLLPVAQRLNDLQPGAVDEAKNASAPALPSS